jgi:hypothetical protein
MASNVHFIGAPRKAGRRRERPLPDAPLADVLDLSTRREERSETAEEQIERFHKVIDEVSHHFLMAARALRSAPERTR